MSGFWRARSVFIASLALLGSAPQPAAAARPTTAVVGGVKAAAPNQRLGDEQVHKITVRGTSHVDFALMSAGVAQAVGEAATQKTAPLQTIRYDLSTELHTRVVGVDAKGTLVSARLQNVNYLVDGSADSRQDLLTMPFTIRYDRTGRITRFVFPDRFPDDLGRAIQRLVEPLQIVMAEAGVTTWSADEHDADVSYTARYQVTATDPKTGRVTLSKSKTAVIPRELAAANLPLAGKPSARINRSSASITLDRQNLVRLSASESVSLFWGKAFFSDYDHTYEASRMQTPLAQLARTGAEAEAHLHDVAFARARLYDVDVHSRRLVEGLRLPQVMSQYHTAVATKPALGTRLLKSWLRLNPGTAREVAQQIDALDPRTDEAGFGWAALASAGHPEAQAVLLHAATQPGWKPASKSKALLAMMNLEAPEPGLIDGVWAERANVVALGNSAARRLSIVTNVYGSLGDITKHNPAQTDRVVRNLATLLGASDARSRVLALDALSNVGDFERVAPLAARHLGASDPLVRVAAFSTFRRMTGEAAFAAFAAAFARETLPQVRLEAARVAAQMEKTGTRNDWATTLVASESDPKVQAELVQILGRSLAAYPDNATTLRELLKTTHLRAVRREIYAFVAPIAQGGVR